VAPLLGFDWVLTVQTNRNCKDFASCEVSAASIVIQINKLIVAV